MGRLLPSEVFPSPEQYEPRDRVTVLRAIRITVLMPHLPSPNLGVFAMGGVLLTGSLLSSTILTQP